MNKYVAIAHSFCDACVNGNTCKGTCKRLTDMVKLAEKYEKLSSAYDRVCDTYAKVCSNGITKDDMKEQFLRGDNDGH